MYFFSVINAEEQPKEKQMTNLEKRTLLENVGKCRALLINSKLINNSDYQDWLLLDTTTGNIMALIGISDNILYKVYYTESYGLSNLAAIKKALRESEEK